MRCSALRYVNIHRIAAQACTAAEAGWRFFEFEWRPIDLHATSVFAVASGL